MANLPRTPPWTILVVDDNRDLREMLSMVLAARGFRVILAKSAIQGIELADRIVLDAVITDYDMDGMNGIDFCRALRSRSHAGRPPPPIWIMTGSRDALSLEHAGSAGAVRVLQKPFPVGEICQEIVGRVLHGV